MLFEQKKIKILGGGEGTEFCGKYNKNYAACLKNSVNFLIA